MAAPTCDDLMVGETHTFASMLEEADFFIRTLNAMPTWLHGYYGLLPLLNTLRRPDMVVQGARKGLQMFPDDAVLMDFELQGILKTFPRPSKSEMLEKFDRALSIPYDDQGRARLLSHRANYFFDIGRPDLSIIDLEKAVMLYPTDMMYENFMLFILH